MELSISPFLYHFCKEPRAFETFNNIVREENMLFGDFEKMNFEILNIIRKLATFKISIFVSIGIPVELEPVEFDDIANRQQAE